MKAVVVIHDTSEVIATFEGETATTDAERYVGDLPDARTGRYGIDVSDDQCPTCGEEFSREAWVDSSEGWRCPQCDALDTRKP